MQHKRKLFQVSLMVAGLAMLGPTISVNATSSRTSSETAAPATESNITENGESTMTYDQVPVFEDGLAQPVFPYTSGKTDNYDPTTSAIARYCVYIETDYDMDNDGKRDLVKAFVQVPRSAAEGNFKAATLYEARPYCSGTNEDGYGHMKEVQDADLAPYDMTLLDNEVPARTPSGYMTTMEAALTADSSDWYFPYSGNDGAYKYQSTDMYDYYLVRGFAVVLCSGFGTYGSDGFEYVGSHYERDAFKAVVEWLHGDRIAYTDRTGTTAIKADWSNGKVAMTGRSYAGTMPFAVATTGVEGLETIIPIAGIADWYSQQNMQGSQRYWPAEVLNSFLSYYCTSQYGEPDLDSVQKDKLDRFLQQMSLDQLRTGCDYSDFWADGNYTLNADQIQCSALIVHGLHDENVSTKQFEMMYKSFQKAGQTVKLLLHQGPHITPSMPPKNYGLDINGEYYDDIVNQWISHYLYDVDNGAKDRPTLLVQSNVDQHKWYTADSWETGKEISITADTDKADDLTRIDTNWEDAGVTAENYDEKMSTASSNMNQRFVTSALKDDLTIQGTVCVNFSAALAAGNAEEDFHPSNPNDADTLTMQIATAAGRQDDLKLTFLLCDIADEEFDNIASSDPQRNKVPVTIVKEDQIPQGGGIEALDLAEFDTVSTKFHVISRAYIDLCNPESGYEPETSAASITLKEGEYHDYQVYLNATRYTLAKGHKLALVITTEDPINCLIHKEYQAAIQDPSIVATIPVVEDHSESLTFHKN